MTKPEQNDSLDKYFACYYPKEVNSPEEACELYKIIIADDHAIVREGIASIIDKSDDFEVVAQAENGKKLLDTLKKVQCDVVLCDIVMPELDGLKALKKVKASYPKIKVVIITMHTDKGFIGDAVNSGADGYVLKNDSSDTILSVLCGVMEGHRCFSPRIQTILAQRHLWQESPEHVLTSREFQVFKLTAKAFTNKEVADKLGIAVSTVEFHKKNIKDKLNARNLADLLNIAHKFDIA